MKITITKKQLYVNDVPQEVQYKIEASRGVSTKFTSEYTFLHASLSKDELRKLRDEINRALEISNVAEV